MLAHRHGSGPEKVRGAAGTPAGSHAVSGAWPAEDRRRALIAKPREDALADVLQRACNERATARARLGNATLQRIVFDAVELTPTEKKQGKKKVFNSRPSEPYRETALEATVFKGEEVDQSRHHIIPWNKLSSFVRAAYRAGHVEQLHSVLSGATRTMMANSPRYMEGERYALAPGVRGGEAKQGDLTLGDLLGEMRKKPDGAEPDSAALEAMSTAFCWMPGNLFLGPLNTLRIDDPDEAFETYAKDQVGPSFERFSATYDLITAYVSQPTVPVARQIASFMQSISAKTTPISFNEKVWSRVEAADGTWRYFLTKAANSDQVKAALAEIRSETSARFKKMVEEHNAWHAAQQEVWARQKEAEKAGKSLIPQ